MSNINNTNISTNRWQPSDHDAIPSPFEEDERRGTRKKLMLVSVYLVLLVGSLFVL